MNHPAALPAEVHDRVLSDDELTDLALAADPEAPLAADAVPLDLYPEAVHGLLPSWYMPPVVARRAKKRWHRVAIGSVVVAFLGIDLLGLCSTYGLPGVA